MTANHSHTRTRSSHRLRISAAILALVLAPQAAARASDDADRLAAWRQRIEKTLNGHGQPKVKLSAQVIDLATGATLYDHDANAPLIPASNMKMMVMAGAIDRLGKDYQFRTVLAVREKDLVVVGGGDPSFGDERIAAAQGHAITAVFHAWAEKLKQAGVKQIPGRLVVDDFVFDSQFVHPNWPADQYQSWYEAPVGGLNFNANCFNVAVSPAAAGAPAKVSLVPGNLLINIINKTVTGKKQGPWARRTKGRDEVSVSGSVARSATLGPMTVRDPGLYFGSVLKTVLAAKGIRVHGEVVRERVKLTKDGVPEGGHVVAVHRAPISDALGRAGQNSLGMMAEGLIKRMGAESGVGSWDSGRAAMRSFFAKAGVPDSQFAIDDGSGLSRKNLLSASAATRVLYFMKTASPTGFELLRKSLARPGREGTLKRRLRGAATKDRIFAKTGYINGVRTLAGIVETTSGRMLAFAFFYNGAGKTRPLSQLQDKACEILIEVPAAQPVGATAQSAGESE